MDQGLPMRDVPQEAPSTQESYLPRLQKLSASLGERREEKKRPSLHSSSQLKQTLQPMGNGAVLDVPVGTKRRVLLLYRGQLSF